MSHAQKGWCVLARLEKIHVQLHVPKRKSSQHQAFDRPWPRNVGSRHSPNDTIQLQPYDFVLVPADSYIYIILYILYNLYFLYFIYIYILRHRLASLSVAMSGLFPTYIVLFQKYIKLFLKYLNLFLKKHWF